MNDLIEVFCKKEMKAQRGWSRQLVGWIAQQQEGESIDTTN